MIVYLYVYGKNNNWGCTLRHPKTGKIRTQTGHHPSLSGETEMLRLAIHVGLSLLKCPCDVKIFGLIPFDDPRYTQTTAPELTVLEYLCW